MYSRQYNKARKKKKERKGIRTKKEVVKPSFADNMIASLVNF